ncbi:MULTISPECIES: hypothetical protein [unclassified Jeotgalibaca]|uniref:hypothetical protein n=1 Tax=unclassified Jeotgalibaca TaxID=2621505 RepID=UPI003FD14F6F
MDEITLCVTDEEYEKLSFLAEYYGLSLSELIKKYSVAQFEAEYEEIKKVTTT